MARQGRPRRACRDRAALLPELGGPGALSRDTFRRRDLGRRDGLPGAPLGARQTVGAQASDSSRQLRVDELAAARDAMALEARCGVGDRTAARVHTGGTAV